VRLHEPDGYECRLAASRDHLRKRLVFRTDEVMLLEDPGQPVGDIERTPPGGAGAATEATSDGQKTAQRLPEASRGVSAYAPTPYESPAETCTVHPVAAGGRGRPLRRR
jgi:hypothetical protein